MQVIKKATGQFTWLKTAEDINDGDIITILDEGQIVPGDYGDRQVHKVKTPSKEGHVSFNQTSINNLVDLLGTETKEWVDKEVKAFVVKVQVGGKLRNVCYLAGKDWTMNDDGEFSAPANKEEAPF